MRKTGRGNELSFEKIWLLFQETAKRFEETDKKFQETDKKIQETTQQLKETDRILTEKIQETERIIAELSKETERKFQETDRKIRQTEGMFTGQWGKLVESLVSGNLARALRERGIDVEGTSQREEKFYKGREYEVDILAKNGKDIVPIEVKTTLKVEDVKDFLETLKVFKKVFSEYRDKNVYGGMAFLRVEEDADKYAYRNGLYVIEVKGDTAKIKNDKKFIPKKW